MPVMEAPNRDSMALWEDRKRTPECFYEFATLSLSLSLCVCLCVYVCVWESGCVCVYLSFQTNLVNASSLSIELFNCTSPLLVREGRGLPPVSFNSLFTSLHQTVKTFTGEMLTQPTARLLAKPMLSRQEAKH